MTINPDGIYLAHIRTNKGDITVELFASDAPITVNNFVFLVREGFYNGVSFHRVLRNFMIQTGDPQGDGSGGPGYRFADEPVSRSYSKGILAMANAGPNTNGSQFFIVHGPQVTLPPRYTIFGQVTEGLDAVDEIAVSPVQASPPQGEVSSPIEPIIIESIEITVGNSGASRSTFAPTLKPTSPKQNPSDFTFTLYQGQERLGSTTLNFSDLQGQPVVLNFWAGLCPPCRAEMPELQEFYDDYQDKVVLLGIDVGQFTSLGNQEDAQALLKELGVTYPAGATADSQIMRNFKVFGMPTTAFVDSKGEIFRSWTGALNLKTLSEITAEMINEEGR